MRFIFHLLALAVVLSAYSGVEGKESDVTSLQIGVQHRPKKCSHKAESGDVISVHYKGELTDGKEFDNSFTRGEPISFKLGSGMVIPGWEQGLLGACEGEKRKLKIPPNLGYGESGAGDTIPGGATLIFYTEVVKIEQK